MCVVVLNHTLPRARGSVADHLLNFGWAFMDAFFVLSGFLITGILLDAKNQPDYFRTFFVRRAFRILPVYYLVLGVLLLATYITGDRMPNWGSPLWFLVYLGNLPTAISGQLPTGLNYSYAPFWSLQIEEQFYLLFPFVVWFLRPRALSVFLAVLIPFSVIMRIVVYLLWPNNEFAGYVLLPCRLDGLAIGAFIATRYREKPWHLSTRQWGWLTVAWLSILFGTVAAVDFDPQSPFVRMIGYLIASIASGHLIIWLIERRGSSFTAWMRTKPIQFLSRSSYTVYLIHWPISMVVTFGLLPVLDRETVRLITFLTTAPLAFLLASLSWRYFEGPMLKYRDKFLMTGRQLRQSSSVVAAPDRIGA
jgi:peptidoglycan/LPS O-acetylase OafA/YrhL